jgi:negative regulator of replication initiation
MGPTIRIDSEVWEHMKKHARPLEDNANTVLRRLLGLSSEVNAEGKAPAERRGVVPPRRRRVREEEKTPQHEYRGPILRALLKKGGKATREEVLKDVDRMMASQFTPFDKLDIDSGAMARWQKSAEWEVHNMRRVGLIRPVSETRRGEWELSPAGKKAAQET